MFSTNYRKSIENSVSVVLVSVSTGNQVEVFPQLWTEEIVCITLLRYLPKARRFLIFEILS